MPDPASVDPELVAIEERKARWAKGERSEQDRESWAAAQGTIG